MLWGGGWGVDPMRSRNTVITKLATKKHCRKKDEGRPKGKGPPKKREPEQTTR